MKVQRQGLLPQSCRQGGVAAMKQNRCSGPLYAATHAVSVGAASQPRGGPWSSFAKAAPRLGRRSLVEGKAKRHRADERAFLTWPSSSKMSHESVGICARCGRAVCGAPSLYVLNQMCGGLQQTSWVSLWSELVQLRESAENAMLFGSSKAGMRAERAGG